MILITYLDKKLSNLFGVTFDGSAWDRAKYVIPRTVIVMLIVAAIFYMGLSR